MTTAWSLLPPAPAAAAEGLSPAASRAASAADGAAPDHEAGSDCSTADTAEEAAPASRRPSKWGPEPACEAGLSPAEVRRPSLAELLRCQAEAGPVPGQADAGAMPPARGFRWPGPAQQRRRCKVPAPSSDCDAGEGELWVLAEQRARGWRRTHKASWNTKLQRKVAEQAARRAGQSQRSHFQFDAQALDDAN